MAKQEKTWPRGAEHAKSSEIDGNTPVMVGVGSTIKSLLMDEFKNYLEITGIELDPIASGALPTPPTGQIRKMVVSGGKTGATWTHSTLPGGSASLTNKEQGVLFWNGTAWRMTNVQELPMTSVLSEINLNDSDAINSEALIKYLDGYAELDILNTTTKVSGSYMSGSDGSITNGFANWDIYRFNVVSGETFDIEIGAHLENQIVGLYTQLPLSVANFIKNIVPAPAQTGKTNVRFTVDQAGILVINNRNQNINPPIIKKVFLYDGVKYINDSNVEKYAVSVNDFVALSQGEVVVKGDEVKNNIAKRVINKSFNITSTTGSYRMFSIDLTNEPIENFPIDLAIDALQYNATNDVPAVVKNVGGVYSVVLDNPTSNDYFKLTTLVTLTERGVYYVNSRDNETNDSDINFKQKVFLYGGLLSIEKSGTKSTQRIIEDGVCVSQPESGELVSHSSTIFTDKYEGGTVVVPYGYQTDTVVEDSAKMELKVAVFNTLKPNNITYLTPLAKGSTVGNWTIPSANWRVPESSVFFDANKTTAKIIFATINANDALGRRVCYMTLNKNTKTIDPLVTNCNVIYKGSTTVFTTQRFVEILNDVHGVTNISATNPLVQNNTSFNFYNDWYYCAFALSSTITNPSNKVTSLLFRTQNGVDFECLGINTAINNQTYPETSTEIIGDTLYSLTRGNGRYTLAKFNLITQTWYSEILTITRGGNIGRPFLINYKGTLYAIVNQPLQDIVLNGVTSVRSVANILEIDTTTFTFIERKKLIVKNGFHYFSVSKDYQDRYWLLHSTDSRQLDSSQNRSNLNMVRFEDIIGL